jgi:hypothetical protein
MCLLLEQGLRVGEVVRLEGGHVELARAILRVESSWILRRASRWSIAVVSLTSVLERRM